MSKVILFQYPDFNGNSRVLEVGKYDTSKIGTTEADTIGSILVQPGMKVIFYGAGDFSGDSESFSKNISDVSAVWGDSVPSLAVEEMPPQVSVYEERDFGGIYVHLKVGTYTAAQLEEIGSPGVASIKVPPGLQVTVQGDGGAEAEATFTGSVSFLGLEFGAVQKIVVEASGAEVIQNFSDAVANSSVGTGLLVDRSRWMAALPDSENISMFSLPGTHDSGARYGGSSVACQDMSLTDQLKSGIRYLDIRGYHAGNELFIYHGFYGQKLKFNDVVAECKAFLTANPTEFILMRVASENPKAGLAALNGSAPYIADNTRSYENTVLETINKDKSLWHYLALGKIPQLSEVRGKIVLIRDWGSPGIIGLDWSSAKLFSIQDKYEISTTENVWDWMFHGEDVVTGDYGEKWDATKGKLDEARKNGDDNKFYVSHASGYWLNPLPQITDVAERLNPKVREYFRSGANSRAKWHCIVPMDFPDERTIRTIIMQNLLSRDGAGLPGYACKIYNIAQKEYMYAADHDTFDSSRRQIFTWRPGNYVYQGRWRIIPIGDGTTCYIWNEYQQEFLYASDYATYDDDRRRVFTWRDMDSVKQAVWKLEDAGSKGIRIYNTYQSEYLYAADYGCYDSDRRRVFTWQTKNQTVKQGYWKIERL